MLATKPRPRLAAIVASIAWAALLLQFWLSLRIAAGNGRSVAMGVVIYFGFFTILTNLAAALALTVPLLRPDGAAGRYFARAGVHTAIAAYIAIVGIAYSLLLRHIWSPQGLQLVVDHVLHDVMPILFVLHWWLAIAKRDVRWSDIPYWLLFPIAYFALTLVRGALTGLYPYPFVDVARLGLLQATINATCVLVALFVVAALLVSLGRLQSRTRPRELA